MEELREQSPGEANSTHKTYKVAPLCLGGRLA